MELVIRKIFRTFSLESKRDCAYLYSYTRVSTTTDVMRSFKSPTCVVVSFLLKFSFFSLVDSPFKIRHYWNTTKHALERVREKEDPFPYPAATL